MMSRVALLLLVCAWTAAAHDLVVDCEFDRPEVLVAASYGPGEPAAKAAVSIASASKPEYLLQTGETDREGRFAFAPPKEGDWLVHVDDGYGHLANRVITVDWRSTAIPNERPNPWTRTGAGLALIFGATGLVVWGKRQSPSPGTPR